MFPPYISYSVPLHIQSGFLGQKSKKFQKIITSPRSSLTHEYRTAPDEAEDEDGQPALGRREEHDQ